MSLPRSVLLWTLLLLLSALIHGWITREVGRNILLKDPSENPASIEVELDLSPDKEEEKEKDRLLFEEPLEIEVPDILVAAKNPIPPPPGVNLALEASAGGHSLAVTGIPLEVDMPLTKGSGVAGYGEGVGTGLANSSRSFAAYVQGLRETGLDIVFVVDATGSMDWVIKEVLARIVDIVDVTRSLVSVSRFGIVAYRDFDDPEFVTRIQPLTFSVTKLTRFLRSFQAKGGGSWKEAVAPAIDAAYRNAGWRVGASRIMIVIGDAPPHDHSMGHIRSVARQFSAQGGQISTLDVSHDANPAVLEAVLGRKVNRAMHRSQPMFQFQEIAESGQGIATTLEGDVSITRQLVSLIMGGQFNREMALLMENL